MAMPCGLSAADGVRMLQPPPVVVSHEYPDAQLPRHLISHSLTLSLPSPTSLSNTPAPLEPNVSLVESATGTQQFRDATANLAGGRLSGARSRLGRGRRATSHRRREARFVSTSPLPFLGAPRAPARLAPCAPSDFSFCYHARCAMCANGTDPGTFFGPWPARLHRSDADSRPLSSSRGL